MLKDGTTVNVVIGEDMNDTVVGISDLLIHLASEQMDKKASKVVEGEALDILVEVCLQSRMIQINLKIKIAEKML